MNYEVRSQMVVETSNTDSLTGGGTHRIGIFGANAQSQTYHNNQNFYQRQQTLGNIRNDVQPGSGRALADSLFQGDQSNNPLNYSLSHAEGHAAYQAARILERRGVDHYQQHHQNSFHLESVQLRQLAQQINPGMNIDEYIRAESRTLAWNDVAKHGQLMGPFNDGSAVQQGHLAPNNPGAWATQGQGPVQNWNSCQNCRNQTIANLDKHA